MKSPRIGDPQDDARSCRRGDSLFRAANIERERLFHKDVLAGGCGALDLFAMLTVRRRKNDRVDCGIGQKPVEIVAIGDVVLGAERRRRGARAAVAHSKPELGAFALDRAH